MEIANWKTEKIFWKKGYEVIGIDEAGRGPLAGPVVAAVATLKNKNLDNLADKNFEKDWYLVRDSKSLSALQREKIFQFIQETFVIGIGIINSKTIDRINILEATFLAMKSAWFNLQSKVSFNKKILLVDGSQIIPNFSIKQKAVKNGDKLVKSIAAASIIAKVTRDKIMKEYALKYPQYGFEKHKGYGTKNHLEALRKYGPSPLHRFSFKPIKKKTLTKF